MADPDSQTADLPPHIEEAIRSIARLHAEHDQNAAFSQRVVDRMTRLFATPVFIGAVTLAVVGWIGINLWLTASGRPPFDPPPFNGLQGLVSLVSLYMVLVIIATQRHEDKLAHHREQLTLQLALLNEQKSAKLIELIEEMRRDSPNLRDRVDEKADAMATPADPGAVSEAIRASQTVGAPDRVDQAPPAADEGDA